MKLFKAILAALWFKPTAPAPAEIPAFLAKLPDSLSPVVVPMPTLADLGVVEPTIAEPAAPEPGQALQPIDPAPEPTIKEQDMRTIAINAVTYYADRAVVHTTVDGRTVDLTTDKASAALYVPGAVYTAPEAADTGSGGSGSGGTVVTVVTTAASTGSGDNTGTAA